MEVVYLDVFGFFYCFLIGFLINFFVLRVIFIVFVRGINLWDFLDIIRYKLDFFLFFFVRNLRFNFLVIFTFVIISLFDLLVFKILFV